MADIYFNPEGYSISGRRLMGRNAAGHSFLRGYFRHNSAKTLFTAITDQAHGDAFEAFAAAEHVKQPVRHITPNCMAELAQAGTLFLPGPGLDLAARQRSLFDRRGWSLCGITHTTLSGRAMDAIAGLLTSPVESWDAVICTSRSVRDTVRKVLEAEAENLQLRLGATRFTLPRLPVIPLGIIADDFKRTQNDRVRSRSKLTISEDEIVVLFVGRLSFHAKAHPAAMYQALERASHGRKITLIECGWFANTAIEHAFAQGAAHLAPNIRRIVLDGRDATMRQHAWHAADIFMSLTDNLQETFGITPIEAMASGLPVIVSDWDGYRDTVRHGVDGFRIPSIMPKAGIAKNIGNRYALEMIDYDYYCGETSHLVAIDIAAATQALEALILNPDRRHQMGADGQRRARATFDWSVIIKIYETLWAELAEERRSAPSLFSRSNEPIPWPARMDPLESFGSYATWQLDKTTELRRVASDTADEIKAQRQLKMFTISDRMLFDHNTVSRIFDLIPTDRTITLDNLCVRSGLPIENLTPLVMFGLKIGRLDTERSAVERQNDGALGIGSQATGDKSPPK